MKKFKKIMAVLVAAVMIMATMVPAWAAAGNSITISVKAKDINNQNLEDQDLVNQEQYFAYKIFDYTTVANPSANIGSGTIGPGDVDTGIAYTISATSPWITLAKINTELADYLTFELSADGSVYNVVRKVNTEVAAKEIAKYLNSFLPTLGTSTLVDPDDNTKTAALPSGEAAKSFSAGSALTTTMGYHLITSSLGSNLILATTNIAIEEKNNYPAVDKAIVVSGSDATSDIVNIGDTVNFKLTAYIPAEANNSVVLHDSMSNGLTLVNNSFRVKVGEDYLVAGTDYNVTKLESAASITSNDTTLYPTEGDEKTAVANSAASLGSYSFTTGGITQTLKIELTDTYVKSLTANTTVVVTYDGILNDNALTASNGNPNTVQLTYSNYKTPEKTVRVYTYAAALLKHNPDGDPLGGASFTGKTPAPAKQLYFVQIADGSATEPAVYRYNSTYVASQNVSGKTTTDTVTTPASGVIIIEGLDALSSPYKFTETASPAGYKRLTGDIDVSVIAATSVLQTDKVVNTSATGKTVTFKAGTSDTYTDAVSGDTITIPLNNSSIFTIENESSGELPSTGGMGTTVLYIVGGMLVILAGAYLFFSRKRTA